MKLSDAARDYIDYIRHERGMTPSTYQAYASWLRHLARWLEANGYPDADISALSTPTLRRYLYHLSGDRNYRPRTVRSVFFLIKGLCKYLVENGAMTSNPMNGISMPKKDAAVRETVSDEEIAALLDACERLRTVRQKALYRAVISTFAYSGLRRSELLDLRVEDVDLRDKSLLVRSGKGKKSRRVWICEECAAAIAEWLAVREKDCQTDYLWMFDRRRRIHDDGLKTLLDTVKAIAGMADHINISCHALRQSDRD